LRIGAQFAIADQYPGVLVSVHYRVDPALSPDRRTANAPAREGVAPVP
jgi:hypothetical protein